MSLDIRNTIHRVRTLPDLRYARKLILWPFNGMARFIRFPFMIFCFSLAIFCIRFYVYVHFSTVLKPLHIRPVFDYRMCLHASSSWEVRRKIMSLTTLLWISLASALDALLNHTLSLCFFALVLPTQCLPGYGFGF